LAALPEAGEARSLPRGQVQSLDAALDRVDYPAGAVFVAVPTGTTLVAKENAGLRDAHYFRSWLLVRVEGPFRSPAGVLQAVAGVLAKVRPALREPVPSALAGWFDLNESVVCKSLLERSGRCGTQ
jgi:hypothetical protein